EPHANTITFLSTVTARPMRGQELNAEYWWQNLRQTVRFADAIEQLVSDASPVFLEIGPHPNLGVPLVEILGDLKINGTVLPSMRKGQQSHAVLRASQAALYCLGFPLDGSSVYPEGGPCVALPAYPWQRERYWLAQDGSYSRAHVSKRSG